jgi:hypothetical protein
VCGGCSAVVRSFSAVLVAGVAHTRAPARAGRVSVLTRVDNRRKGNETFSVTVTVGEGMVDDTGGPVFFMSAAGSGSGTTVQRMSLAQMKASTNPFLQQTLVKFFSKR